MFPGTWSSSRSSSSSSSSSRRPSGLIFLLAFHALSLYSARPRKPPFTAALILSNLLFFFRPGPLHHFLPSTADVCLNPHLVLKDWDAKRLFLSAFYHFDETHLVYNMLSLLWKGVQLESTMGTMQFAKMVALLLSLSHGLVVLVAKGLDTFADYPDALYSHCAVGFSAVLFALKVVLNSNSPTYTNVYGVLVPARYAAWAELILVQMFVPGTSFIGHLCGILAGLLYVHGPHWFAASGILPALHRRLLHIRHRLFWPLQIFLRPFFRRRGRSTGRRLSTPRDNPPADGSGRNNQGIASVVWRCQMCTYDNIIYSDYCEMCRAPRSERVSPSPSEPSWPTAPSTLSVDEMRRARLARFTRR